MPRPYFNIKSWLRPTLSGLVAATIGVGSPSCGSWGGNPPSSKVQTGTMPSVEKQGTVDIVLTGTGTALRLLDKSLKVTDRNGRFAGQINLTSVQIVVSDITIRRDASDSSVRPSLPGPFVLDLLTNTISPQPGRLTLPEGTYRDLAFKLYQKAGGSVQLNGTYVNGMQRPMAVKIALDAEDSISLMNESSLIQVSASANQEAVVTFRLDQWFNFSGKDADLSQATGQDIVIDGTAIGETRKLREAFLSNVKAGTVFGKVEADTSSKDDWKKDNGPHKDGDGFKGGR